VKNKEIYKAPPDLDAPYIRYPNERLGCQMHVNWRFARYGVIALGENAFRNLHTRHLQMYCQGKADKNRALHITTDSATPTSYFVDTGHFESFLPTNNTIDGTEWRSLMTQVTAHLSESSSLFMTDAAVGDSTEVETRLRVISNDPNASLYLKSVLAPTAGDLYSFTHHAVVYHAPDFVLKEPESVGITSKGPFVIQMLMKGSVAYENLDAEKKAAITPEEKEAMANQVAGVVIVCGTNSLSTLRSSITNMTDYFNISNAQLPLYASTIKNSKGQISLVFDPSESLLSGSTKHLASSEHCIWTAKGVVNSFVGITHGNVEASKAGALVTSVGKSKRVTTNGQRVTSAQPSSIVFVVDDASKTLPLVGTITDPNVAAAFFAKYGGYSLSANLKNQVARGFEQLLKDSKAKIHVLNTHSQTAVRRDELLNALSEGQVPKDAKTVTAVN